MNKLELTEEGTNFKRNLICCLNWLAVGGEIKTSGGHRLAMIDNGMIGFAATNFNTVTHESKDIVYQCDSDVAWQTLSHHARSMTEKDRFIMAGNITLNEA